VPNGHTEYSWWADDTGMLNMLLHSTQQDANRLCSLQWALQPPPRPVQLQLNLPSLVSTRLVRVNSQELWSVCEGPAVI